MKTNKTSFLAAWAAKVSLICALLLQSASSARASSPYGEAADKYPSGVVIERQDAGRGSGLIFLKWRAVDPLSETG